MTKQRRALENLTVPDRYPATPQPVDLTRVAPEVARPWLRGLWTIVVVLALLVLAAAWIALEIRAARDMARARAQHEEVLYGELGR